MKEIIENPDIFSKRKKVSKHVLKFLKQYGEAIIVGFLENTKRFCDSKSKITQYLFPGDMQFRDLIILRTSYPMIFELLNKISLDIDPNYHEFMESFGLPPIKKNSTFNEYYLNVIVGLGFGMFNNYLKDDKFETGFIKKNEKLMRKEILLNYITF